MALEAQCHNKSSKMLEKFYLGILIACGFAMARWIKTLHAEQRGWGSNRPMFVRLFSHQEAEK